MYNFGIRSTLHYILVVSKQNKLNVVTFISMNHYLVDVLTALMLQISRQRSSNSVCKNIYELKSWFVNRRKPNVP